MATRRELSLKPRVLVIDEDRDTCELLEEHLAREGMTVHLAHDGKSGLMHGLSGEHDFVILDLKLPQLTGLEVTKRLRAHSTVGILILSDRSEKVDNIIGLEFGADDCLVKPFNPSELVARMRAISRRRTPWLTRESAGCEGSVMCTFALPHSPQRSLRRRCLQQTIFRSNQKHASRRLNSLNGRISLGLGLCGRVFPVQLLAACKPSSYGSLTGSTK